MPRNLTWPTSSDKPLQVSNNIALFLLFFPVFLFSLSFHEYAHAWAANRLGDPTARLMGRMTLNPIPHIDPIGTILFPLMMFLFPGLILFGWARPVPVDGRNLKGGRKGHLRVSAAGPIANLLLATLFGVLLHLLLFVPQGSGWLDIFARMLETGVYLNLMLSFFNLIPLPPLDGAGVLAGLLPGRYLPVFENLGRYSFIILFAALYLGLFRILSIPIFKAARLLLP